jgi:hypothetical protein
MLIPMVYPDSFLRANPNSKQSMFVVDRSVHLPDQVVDLVFPVAQVTAFNEVLELPLTEAASWAVKLEWP